MKSKILIIRLGSLGDIVLTSATVINLKLAYPESELHYLCKDKFKSLVELIPGVDRIHSLPEDISLAGYTKLLFDLDKNNFDMVFDLHGNFRSWLARKIISADIKNVYPKRRVERMMAVKKKEFGEQYPHTIDLYNSAISEHVARIHCSRPQLKIVSDKFDKQIEQFQSDNDRFVVIAPGAAHPTKQWPIENFAETARLLNLEVGLGIVWAVTSIDKDYMLPQNDIPADSFIKLVDHSINSLSVLIEQAEIVLANDSGLMHVASAVNTPVVAMFGPTHPVLGFSPAGLFDRIIQVDEPCRPCSLHGKTECYRESRFCFDRLEPRRLVNHIKPLLKEREQPHPAIFIDRDGTIIKDKHFLSDPAGIEFIDGSLEALQILQQAGFKLVIVSNQSGVARGKFKMEAVENINRSMQEMLTKSEILIDALYYCPHHPDGNVQPYNIFCNCRKPSPGMVEDAAHQLNLNLRSSFVIGDKIDDVNLGKVVGIKPYLVRTGYGEEHQSKINPSPFYGDITIVNNLLEAARSIIEYGKKS